MHEVFASHKSSEEASFDLGVKIAGLCKMAIYGCFDFEWALMTLAS